MPDAHADVAATYAIRRHADGVRVWFGFLVFIGGGFVEVWVILMKGFVFHASIPETKDEVPKKWLRRVKIVKWLKR